ncbi:MAG: glycosyltransferase family 4 protein [Acidobacteriota bacterium]
MSIRVCTVVFNRYPRDVRVRREAEAMVEAGMLVDVVCLRGAGEAHRETVRGVEVFRLPQRKKRRGKFQYLWDYGLFLWLAFVQVSFLRLKNRYQLVHVHNMPDILVLAAILPRLLGAKIILDLHDPMPEMYRTKFRVRSDHRVIRLLTHLEKWSIRFAHLVLTPNTAFRKRFISRGCPEAKIKVIMNSPQEEVFCPRHREAREAADARSEFVLMFHGLITERHGLDTALEAVASLRDAIPRIRFHIYGTGDGFLQQCRSLTEQLELTDVVRFHGFISIEEIAAAIRRVDLGIIPNKRTVFTEINLPTRILEYLCLGRPVVAPRTEGITDYFDDNALFFFEPGNAESLARTILRVKRDRGLREAVIERGGRIHRQHRWESQKRDLVRHSLRLLKMERTSTFVPAEQAKRPPFLILKS